MIPWVWPIFFSISLAIAAVVFTAYKSKQTIRKRETCYSNAPLSRAVKFAGQSLKQSSKKPLNTVITNKTSFKTHFVATSDLWNVNVIEKSNNLSTFMCSTHSLSGPWLDWAEWMYGWIDEWLTDATASTARLSNQNFLWHGRPSRPNHLAMLLDNCMLLRLPFKSYQISHNSGFLSLVYKLAKRLWLRLMINQF